jgi:capsular polysaccharide biosynthesis protein
MVPEKKALMRVMANRLALHWGLTDLSRLEEDLDMLDILFVFKKHLKLLVIFAILFAVAGYAVSAYLMTPQFEADATMIVNSSKEQAETITYDQITAAQQLVDTYAVLLKSDSVMRQVNKNLSLHSTPEKLADCVTVTGVNQTEVLCITVRYPNAHRAAAIANQITKIAPEFIIRTVKAGSVEVISKAKVNTTPVSPNKTQNAAIAMLAGLILAMLIAFTLEVWNNRFVTCNDIQKNLGITVLGIIPAVKDKRKSGIGYGVN